MIYIDRLYTSDFNAVANDAEFRAAMAFWLKSSRRVPAGSLPDDDEQLALLAGLSREKRKWQKVKAVAMRGWIKCSDGLFYHPVVAAVVLEAWIGRIKQRKSSAAGVAKKKQIAFDPRKLDSQLAEAMRLLAIVAPQARLLDKAGYIAGNGEKYPTTGPTAGEPAEDQRSTGGPTAGEPAVVLAVNQGKGSEALSVFSKEKTGAGAVDGGEGNAGTDKPKPGAKPKTPAEEARKRLFDEGKQILGSSAGGLIKNLLEVTEGDVAKAAWMLSDAAKQTEPRSWLVAAMRKRAKPGQDVWGLQGSM